ncbi:ALP1-like protein [Tanacetum coccineum]
MLVWGEVDSETLQKKGVYEESSSRHAAWIGGKLIQLMHTTMVQEQVKTMKIQAGIQVLRRGELRRQLQLWKRFGRLYYVHYEEKHRFPGMLGSLDCTEWECFGCPYAYKAQYVRRDHVNDLKTERVPEISFVANSVTYPSGYYLVDGIFLELATLVKTIREPSDDNYKRIRYKQMRESARKDVKRSFNLLKKKWAILANPARAMKKRKNNKYDKYMHHIKYDSRTI